MFAVLFLSSSIPLSQFIFHGGDSRSSMTDHGILTVRRLNFRGSLFEVGSRFTEGDSDFSPGFFYAYFKLFRRFTAGGLDLFKFCVGLPQRELRRRHLQPCVALFFVYFSLFHLRPPLRFSIAAPFFASRYQQNNTAGQRDHPHDRRG